MRGVRESGAASDTETIRAVNALKALKPLEAPIPEAPTGSKTTESNTFLVTITGRQYETWQGTATLLGGKCVRAPKPRNTSSGDRASKIDAGGSETICFRSLLEFIHLINDVFPAGEKN
jgi:hypothetical protein